MQQLLWSTTPHHFISWSILFVLLCFAWSTFVHRRCKITPLEHKKAKQPKVQNMFCLYLMTLHQLLWSTNVHQPYWCKITMHIRGESASKVLCFAFLKHISKQNSKCSDLWPTLFLHLWCTTRVKEIFSPSDCDLACPCCTLYIKDVKCFFEI